VSRAGLVIVGGSYAAMNIAAGARAAGYDAPIRMVGEESVAPYHRPPLSKTHLSGKSDATTLPLRADVFYREQGIDLLLETRVQAIDRVHRRVMTQGGRSLEYDHLALAVGARPRPLRVPGGLADGVMTLRSLRDADALKARAAAASSIVIVGGGFIGLEVASVLAGQGKSVTVIEMQDRLLARALSTPLAAFLADRHRTQGVTLIMGAAVASIDDADGHVRAVRLADGRSLAADLVVAGIGAMPNVELAEACGLPCRDGIEVDAQGRTADPSIVAAGDCTAHPSRYAGRRIRLESVQNATDQAKVAGATIAGGVVAYDVVPWFWSDQYELKIQMVGLARPGDDAVLRGDPSTGRFSVIHLRDGIVAAIESINRPADHMAGRKLIAAGARLSTAEAADSAFDLRSREPADGPRDAA
jgi:3-phenylpropionate/trans-cinnamate dioxygenase ferredoxin reductase subunit